MPRIERWLAPLALLALIATSLVPTPAQAQEGEIFEFGPRPTWSVLAGPTGGGSFGSPGGGGFLGAELSIARLERKFWFGAYADGSYDFGHQTGTFTAGPQFGLGFFGLDGGVALRTEAFDEPGATARFLVTSGFFALYGRWLFFPAADEHVGQVGVVLKLPIWAN